MDKVGLFFHQSVFFHFSTQFGDSCKQLMHMEMSANNNRKRRKVKVILWRCNPILCQDLVGPVTHKAVMELWAETEREPTPEETS